MKYSYSGLITVFVFCLIWQLLSYSSFVKPNIYFPPISTVLIITVKSILSGELLFHIAITLYRAIIGLVIALFLAIPLGILMGYYKKVHDAGKIMIELLRPLPPIAMIPVGILFLGLYDQMKISIIAFGCFWPILVNTIAGVQQISQDMLDVAKVFRLSRKKILYEVVFRSALPYILAGIRVALSIALIVSVAADMLVGSDGIGFFIVDAERSFKFADMYAGLVSLAIVGHLLNYGLEYVYKKTNLYYGGMST